MEQDYLRRGLSDLRTASLLFLVSLVLSIIGALVLLPLMLATSLTATVGLRAPVAQNWVAMLAAVGAAMVPLLVAFLLSLFAIYGKLLPSSKHLAKWRPAAFDTPRKMLYIGYWGGLATGIVGFIVLIVALFPSLSARGAPYQGSPALLVGFFVFLAFLVIAAILSFIGRIGELLLYHELSSNLSSPRYRTALILIIAAMVLSFFAVIPFAAVIVVVIALALELAGYYLIYDESGKRLQALSAPTQVQQL